MKILAASDIHEDRKAIKKLAEKAYKEKVDLVVLCGDLTFFDNDTKGLIGPFLEKKKKVLFVPGNHDSPTTADFLVEKYKINDVQHYAVMINGVGFFGCGFANIGPNFMMEKDIFNYLKNGFRYIQNAEKKVMITHVPPAGTKIEKMSFPCSKSVRKAIEKFKPDLHLSGHMHETEGMIEYIGKTKLMNVGKKGKIIEI